MSRSGPGQRLGVQGRADALTCAGILPHAHLCQGTAHLQCPVSLMPSSCLLNSRVKITNNKLTNTRVDPSSEDYCLTFTSFLEFVWGKLRPFCIIRHLCSHCPG